MHGSRKSGHDLSGLLNAASNGGPLFRSGASLKSFLRQIGALTPLCESSDPSNAKWAVPREDLDSAALVRISSPNHNDLKPKSAARRAFCRTASSSLIFSRDPGMAMPKRGNQAALARRPHPSLCSSRIGFDGSRGCRIPRAGISIPADAGDRNPSPLGSTPT